MCKEIPNLDRIDQIQDSMTSDERAAYEQMLDTVFDPFGLSIFGIPSPFTAGAPDARSDERS